MTDQERREAAARAWDAAGRPGKGDVLEAFDLALVKPDTGYGAGRYGSGSASLWYRSPGLAREDWSRWLDDNPLPALAPTMTPEAMIAALEAGGWDVSWVRPPRVGGYDDASAVLAWLDSLIETNRLREHVSHLDYRRFGDTRSNLRDEAARLRALGVKPPGGAP